MRSKKLIKGLIYGALCASMLGLVSLKYSLAVNIDDSSPYTLFLVKKGVKPTAVDEYIVFQPPLTSRFTNRFVKMVGGMPGDEVKVVGDSFFVNGVFLGVAKDRDSQGRTVQKASGGVIPSGKYFIYSKKENSYDSKYAEIGLVSDNQLIGVAVALL